MKTSKLFPAIKHLRQILINYGASECLSGAQIKVFPRQKTRFCHIFGPKPKAGQKTKNHCNAINYSPKRPFCQGKINLKNPQKLDISNLTKWKN